jgi:cell shape-determining protein MreD
MRRLGKRIARALPALVLLVLAASPVLAGNKFEIIGGGIAGSSSVKREHLQLLLYAVGGLSLLLSLMTLLVPHNNALFLNFANWKQSAAVFLIVGVLAVGGGWLLN